MKNRHLSKLKLGGCLALGLAAVASATAAEMRELVRDNLCSSLLGDRLTGGRKSPNCKAGLQTLKVSVAAAKTPTTFSLPDGSSLAVDNILTYNGSLTPEVWRLRAGHTLDVTLQNRLNGASGLELTNLHTHGMIVSPRISTIKKNGHDEIVGPIGDNVFVCSVPREQAGDPNSPALQACYDKGLAVGPKPDEIHYRIKVPATHPEGVFWYHPHIHKTAEAQLGSGLSGLIWVKAQQDFLSRHGRERFVMLKDFPLLAAADGRWTTYQKGGGTALPGCAGDASAAANMGFCNGKVGDADGKWLFTVNGQVLPTATLHEPEGEIWHIANTSADISYTLQLVAGEDGPTDTPLRLQLLSRDGVYIAQDGSGVSPSQLTAQPIVLMPAARIDVLVKPQWLSVDGQPVRSARLITRGIHTGAVDGKGDDWPAATLAKLIVSDSALARSNDNGLIVREGSRVLVGKAVAELKANVGEAVQQFRNFVHDHSGGGHQHGAMPAGDLCSAEDLRPLVPGEARLVVVNIRSGDTEEFVIGADRIRLDTPDLPGAIARLALDTTKTQSIEKQGAKPQVCTVAGRSETWIVANPLASEIAGAGGDAASSNQELHNFHIHQMKFRVDYVQNHANCTPGVGGLNGCVSMPPAEGRLVDTYPIPAGGWIRVQVPFDQTQVGDFVYHCHILEHEDHGMMAHIRVEPPQATVAPGRTAMVEHHDH